MLLTVLTAFVFMQLRMSCLLGRWQTCVFRKLLSWKIERFVMGRINFEYI